MLTLAAPVQQQALRDLDQLQGAWSSLAGPKEARLLIAGSRFTFELIGSDIYMGRFELHADGMDMSIEQGPDEHMGKMALCIYRLEGGVLRWCPGRPGSSRRMSEFPGVDDPRYMSFVFQRSRRRSAAR